MKKIQLPSNVTRKLHKVGFVFKKHSPEILVAAGVVGTVASAVLACKATLKVNAVLDEAKTNIEKIHEATEKGVTAAGEEYTAEDSKKDLAIVYAHTGGQFVKLYGPAVILGALSITGILKSHSILRKRNVALAAAYATERTCFKDYRKRLVERFGEDLDRELKYNIKAKEVEEVVINEDGTETVVKKTVEVVDPNTLGDFVRCFDETCTGWSKDAEYNFIFLKHKQAEANDILQRRGYLFLNEVFDMIGMQRSVIGQTAGWIYDEVAPVGDNFVDFGIFDLHDENKRNFVNGYERSIWLDFNVDGNILDALK